jgi:hypothetical protein
MMIIISGSESTVRSRSNGMRAYASRLCNVYISQIEVQTFVTFPI